MSITRAPRPTANFYMLSKKISEDRRLSWSARGLLVFLLGKPDYWSVSPSALVNETADSPRRVGRDGVYAIFKELKEAGYLKTMGARNDRGVFAGADYIVSEQPHTAFPDTADLPDTAEPDTAEPDTANPTLVSTEKKQELNKKQELKNTVAPFGVCDSVWEDFLKVRQAKKSPLTNTALSGIQREADKAGYTLEDALKTCCERGWAGFKAEWVNDASPSRSTAKTSGKHSGFEKLNYHEGIEEDGTFV